MASIQPVDPKKKSNIVIVCKDGTKITTVVKIKVEGTADDRIKALVLKGITTAKLMDIKDNKSKHFKELTALFDSFKRKGAGAVKSAISGKGRRRGKGRRKPKVVKPERPPPRPTINVVRIVRWLQNIRTGKAKEKLAAADALHINSEYVEDFLGGRGMQPMVTVAVFNALYQTERFKGYLLSESYMKDEFAALQDFVSANKGALTKRADTKVMDAADMFIRHFLLGLEAAGIDRYREEVEQIPSMKERLQNIVKEAKSGTTEGAIDSGTITAAALYLRRWYLENPGKGKKKLKQGRIPVWKAPKVLKMEEKKAPVTKPTELQKFAESNWKKLPDRIYTETMKRKPVALIKLMRKLPEGQKSLEDALEKLKRNDVQQAFDKIYNDFIREHDAFRTFVKVSGYGGVKEDSDFYKVFIKLDDKSKQEDRTFIAKTVQDFLNATADKVERTWYRSLNEDLSTLYREVLKLERDTLDVNGVADIRTIAAVAVYRWRLGNLVSPGGKWAEPLGVEPAEKRKKEKPIPLPFK